MNEQRIKCPYCNRFNTNVEWHEEDPETLQWTQCDYCLKEFRFYYTEYTEYTFITYKIEDLE